ncbi:MAG: VirB3 family type IV secretion system protein [Candidatus Eremiobacteraeota bacterium]|nr:VirB3 family type IV secretion system protein [Candidatus Eremiobacteraeota bacterium]
MEPVRTRVRQSLLRPLLVFGGERELVFGSGMLAAVLVFSLGDLKLAAVGAGFWFLSLVVFQRMAKHDPQMTRVYIRHLNKKIFYPAHAHASAPDPIIKKNQ